MKSDKLLFVAATSATYNIALQLCMRILTFVLNAFILRYISKDVLGVVNVRLLLLYTTVQFLSREPFRRSCLSSKCQWEQIVNITWFTVPVSVVCGSVLRFVWLAWLHQPDAAIRDYSIGVNVVVVSVVIEMFAEPLFITAQSRGFVRLKVAVEGIALSIRTVCMACLVVIYPDSGILAFSVGQILSSLVYTSLYYCYFTFKAQTIPPKNEESLPFTNISEVFPKAFCGKSFVDWDVVKLTWSFLKQTILKQLLTEGERYVMTVFNVLTFAEQGIYDVVNNLGSLAARFIFQPIEESGYLYFGQVIRRGESAQIQDKNDVHLSLTILQHLTKLMMMLGFIILTFGFSYSQLLLYIYGGKALALGVGPVLMRWHCVYVLFIAINGVTECFVFAAMSQHAIDKYNKKMLLLSVIFLTSSYFLTRNFGSPGFIMANCLNMACRILHSAYFIYCYFRGFVFQPFTGLCPKVPVCLAFIASFGVTTLSERYLCCFWGPLYWLWHMLIGSFCLLAIIVTIVLTEKHLMSFLYKLWKTGRGTLNDDAMKNKSE